VLARHRARMRAMSGIVFWLSAVDVLMTLRQSSQRPARNAATARSSSSRWEDCLSVISTSTALNQNTMPDIARMRARCLANTGRAIEARDELLAFEQRTGESTVEHLDALAKICWMAGDMRRTEEAATKLVARSPQSADGYLLLGAVAQARGDLDAASRAYARAVEIDPNRAVAAELARRSEAARLALGGLASSGNTE